MDYTDLSRIALLFGGEGIEPQERQNLVKEVLLMTLSRASSADSNVRPVEINVIQNILKESTGEDFSESQIRMAAHSELYESAPLEAYLSRVAHTLNEEDRHLIAKSLEHVIRSDLHITYKEVEFYNLVVDALKITPATAIGLIAE